MLLREIDAKIGDQLQANLHGENFKSTQNAGIILAIAAYFSLREKKFGEPTEMLFSEAVLAYFTEGGFACTKEFARSECTRHDLTNHMHVIELYLRRHFTQPVLSAA